MLLASSDVSFEFYLDAFKAVAETWRRVWGDGKIFRRPRWRFFLKKRQKFLMTFFGHQPGFSNFPSLLPDFSFLYYVYDPFLTKNTFSYSFHTFAHIRQYYFSKYWGANAWAVPFTSNFGGTVPPVPPRFPSLIQGTCIPLFAVMMTVEIQDKTMWSQMHVK